MLAVGVASPPERMEAHSSSISADRACLVRGGGAMPNLEGARPPPGAAKVEGYPPQGLGPESLLSSDLCRVRPTARPPPLRPLDGRDGGPVEGYTPKGGRGLVEG